MKTVLAVAEVEDEDVVLTVKSRHHGSFKLAELKQQVTAAGRPSFSRIIRARSSLSPIGACPCRRA
jgi:hypothetical protein